MAGVLVVIAIMAISFWPYWIKLFSKLRGAYLGFVLKRSADIFFENDYINPKKFYLYRFRKVPSRSTIDGVDLSKTFEYINSNYAQDILHLYQSCSFNKQLEKQQFDYSVFVLKDKIMIILGHSWVTVLFTEKKFAWVDSLVKTLNLFREPVKEKDFEINIITAGNYGLDLKPMPLKPIDLDLDLYYNDDFAAVDSVIKERLGRTDDKGIVLLHGLPGTGKTTYLRHLIGSLKKKVLFVSPSVAGNLMNPEFVDLLIDNPNSILVIEDAENIMMDRKFNSNSSVSNLLNISDGLLSDCMNVQLICTFNSDLNLIDPALMRKGRLIARYEFGKLATKKAQGLSQKLGFSNVVNKPMTLAEITTQGDMEAAVRRVDVIGFRRQEEVMN